MLLICEISSSHGGGALMMEAARTSETSIDNYFTRQYIPENKSELHAIDRFVRKQSKAAPLHAMVTPGGGGEEV
jgi:hypothetical protein